MTEQEETPDTTAGRSAAAPAANAADHMRCDSCHQTGVRNCTCGPVVASGDGAVPDRLRPVIYLDVDDTILCWPPDRSRAWYELHRDGELAPDAVAFVRWAVTHCEVRWLTCWTLAGVMSERSTAKLIGLGLDPADLAQIANPLRWGRDKTTGINWEEHQAQRPWVWIEDGLPPDELEILDTRSARDHYLYTNVSKDPHALGRTWDEVARRFGLPR